MKQTRACEIVLILCCLFFATPSVEAQEALHNAPSSAQAGTPLFDYLQALGNKFDCFFTLEAAWGSDESIGNFQTRRIANNGNDITVQLEKVSNVEMALEELQRSVPGFSYSIDSSKPQIIHIIDTRLNQQPNPLNSILPSIDFHDRVLELLNTIGKQESMIKRQMSFDTGEMKLYDSSSIVKVQAVSLSVREILSNFIALTERRSRILWIARTELGANKITYIYYINYPQQPKMTIN
jgi:hypothetical protein